MNYPGISGLVMSMHPGKKEMIKLIIKKVNDFKVYPNPVQDVANLDIAAVNGSGRISVSVMNIAGIGQFLPAGIFQTDRQSGCRRVSVTIKAITDGHDKSG